MFNNLLNFIPVLAYYVYMHVCSVEVDTAIPCHNFTGKVSHNTLLLSRGGKASLLPPTTRVERFAGGLA